ncbi:hypothetical protein F4778DRAFT_747329 [Xylariomycetidae sp. FL2044]|nr:hypothetical protein F4778DRAFT_747329 [Xylariomycetidae sp. FL2044]
MEQTSNQHSGSSESPLVEHPKLQWHTMSQAAADLYDSGVKLWTKDNLAKIERDLARSHEVAEFTIRCIDGSILRIKNSLQGVQKPIWKPQVYFKDYWRLVFELRSDFFNDYQCSYYVSWSNEALQGIEAPKQNPKPDFEQQMQAWNSSKACEFLTTQVHNLLLAHRVTKVVCFGLGNFVLDPEDFLQQENGLLSEKKQKSVAERMNKYMVQHAMAFAMVEEIRRKSQHEVRLLAQDPSYATTAKECLREKGSEIVGEFGAGGFAEVDDETLVFSVYPSFPITQIIADIARPAMIIGTCFTQILQPCRDTWLDADSPRTLDMWKEYNHCKVPDAKSLPGHMDWIEDLEIFAKASVNDEPTGPGTKSESVQC